MTVMTIAIVASLAIGAAHVRCMRFEAALRRSKERCDMMRRNYWLKSCEASELRVAYRELRIERDEFAREAEVRSAVRERVFS